MTTQADTRIPDIARDERGIDAGLMPGPPLREELPGSATSSQSRRDPSTRACGAEVSLQENREIVTNILRYLGNRKDLPNILLVCWAWSQWAAEILWSRPDLQRETSLRDLIRTLESPNPTYTYSKFIRRLNLLPLGSSVSDSMLTTFSRCELLERVTLIRCQHLESAALEATLKSWPNLVSIDLTDVPAVTNEVIASLTETSHNLLGINFTGCKLLGDPALISIAQNCPDLCRLKMGGCDLATDVGISAVVKGCPKLLELDIHRCSGITDIAIRAVWTHSRGMRELRLSSCDALTDLAFPTFFVVDSESEDVSQNREDENADLLGQGESSRPSVVAAEEGAVNTDPPQSTSEDKKVASTDPQAPNSPLPGTSLTSVELSPLFIHWGLTSMRTLDLSDCGQITDAAIEGIIAHAPGIRSLVLSRCSLLTDRSVKAICKLGRSLHYLNLGHVEQITDEWVEQLARSCNRLRYVDFASCTNLTDESAVALSTHLHKIRRVGFVKVSKLTDAAVYALVQRAATLERLHLSQCTHITAEAIHFLLTRAHKINHLSLTGVPSFVNSSLKLLVFCREAPKHFNYSQRAIFRVYSGRGIAKLRSHLHEVFAGQASDDLEVANAIGDAAPPAVEDVESDSDRSEFE